MGGGLENRETAEHRFAVTAAGVVHGLAEHAAHAGQVAEDGDEVFASDAGGVLVHFLEGDQIGFQVINNPGDGLQVGLAVGIFAVIDIVGQDSKPAGPDGWAWQPVSAASDRQSRR